MSQGSIVKVSGPLVVAQGMGDANMYDVVRVSDKGLIGEIVEIHGDKAYIQVYEETSGLGPGEPVESTGQPLSVELGPGLIESIYDGIQRPLTAIREQAGDRIARGVQVPSLDRGKKWHFTPRVEKGTYVTAGDIIGVVQETPVVEHRIMVPYGIEGTIEEIYEGDFTVEETVARVATKDGIKELSMMQRWPVRRGRPYKRKLPPDRPLVTGQRVIDTLFPVAKGGTACIPGPFGSGKCVSGSTPVMLGDGSITTMKKLFEEACHRGRVIIEGHETYVRLDGPIGLYSMGEHKVTVQTSTLLYKGKSDMLLRVRTRSGRTAEVTPVHKLFKITGDGSVIETEACRLKPGDFIAAVRHVDVPCAEAEFDIDLPADARVMDETLRAEMSAILRQRRRQSNLAAAIGMHDDVLESIIYNRLTVSVDGMRRIYGAAGMKAPVPQRLRGARAGHIVNIPRNVTPELAELAGLFVAEGYIRDEGTLIFTNSDEALRRRFADLVMAVFGVPAKPLFQEDKTPGVVVFSKTLVDIFKAMGLDGKAGDKGIPDMILRSDNDVLASFVRGYYLGDGSIYGGKIEFSTASYDLYIKLSYLLTRLGIFHTMSAKGRRYRIFIQGQKELERFYEAVAGPWRQHQKFTAIKAYVESKTSTYTAHDVVPISPEIIEKAYAAAGRPYAQLKAAGIEISNYTKNGERMSADTFRRFVDIIGDTAGDQLKHLAGLLDDIFCDEVVAIEEMAGPFDVYDVTVPDTRNFVGGFGALVLHNTVVQHQLAKWADADIIVYVGCGERGNEMTDVLMEFPELKDPRSGQPLMKRTVLIANTSDMPVAAREASIYTGITIAEYFRDMGYSVALMADSTSRWAEALREMSGRLEEMPGEEGYPAYLSSRLAEFYERAGYVKCLGSDDREGTLTAVGAVSPPGGDISEPVTQATLRIVKVFWSLDAQLAYARHFPAINWLLSYSLYVDNIRDWMTQNVAADWMDLRAQAMRLLQEEASLEEIVRLVGIDAVSVRDRWVLEAARSIREDFLHQIAFDEVDTYTSIEKQYRMLKLIMDYYRRGRQALDAGVALNAILELPVRERIGRAKYIKEQDMAQFDGIEKELAEQFASLLEQNKA